MRVKRVREKSESNKGESKDCEDEEKLIRKWSDSDSESENEEVR